VTSRSSAAAAHRDSRARAYSSTRARSSSARGAGPAFRPFGGGAVNALVRSGDLRGPQRGAGTLK
jgi:hypothetical protein